MRNIIVLTLTSLVAADVRLNLKQPGAKLGGKFRTPSTFAYADLVKQKQNNNDQYTRSNVNNEANQRNIANEEPRDMLPCRQDAKGPLMTYQKGVPIEIPLIWNNPHDTDCEVNIFVAGMTQVIPVKRPFNCGGGYQDQKHFFIIPNDLNGCTSPADNCVVQIYGHSVEPRTYAMCIDFVIGTPANAFNDATPKGYTKSFQSNNPFMARKAPNGQDLPNAVPQPAIHYHDSFETSFVDSSYSAYQGQQKEFIRPQLAAAIELMTTVPNGGLLKADNINRQLTAKLRAEVKNAIKAAEAQAKAANRAQQAALNKAAPPGAAPACFEGELYGVVNNAACRRQYTNTYVTNVDYQKILENFKPKFAANGLTPYQPKLKDTVGITPPVPQGNFRFDGKRSLLPKAEALKNPAAAFNVAPLPKRGEQFSFAALGPLKGAEPLSPPLKSDYLSGPKGQNGAGAGGGPGQDVPKAGELGSRSAAVGKPEYAPGEDPVPTAPDNQNAPESTVNPDDQVAQGNNDKNAAAEPTPAAPASPAAPAPAPTQPSPAQYPAPPANAPNAPAPAPQYPAPNAPNAPQYPTGVDTPIQGAETSGIPGYGAPKPQGTQGAILPSSATKATTISGLFAMIAVLAMY
jgi:hypothetical protein